MPNLIACLLTKSSDTANEALRLHDQAYAQFVEEVKTKKGLHAAADGTKIKLTPMITQLMTSENLTDDKHYNEVKKAIMDWYEPTLPPEKQMSLGTVQTVLIDVVETVRELQQNQQKTELVEACFNYKLHLEEAIQKEIFKLSRTDHNYYYNPAGHVADKRGVQMLVDDYMRPGSSIPRSDNLSKLINKYKAIQKAEGKLQEKGVAIDQQIDNFKNSIKEDSPILVERRDGGFMTFIKAVSTTLHEKLSTLLSLGTTTGEEFIKDIESKAGTKFKSGK